MNEITRNLYSFYSEIAHLANLGHGDLAGISFVGDAKGGWPAFLLGGEGLTESQITAVAEAMDNRRVPSVWIREMIRNEDFDLLAREKGIRQVNLWQGMKLSRKDHYQVFHGDLNGDIQIQKVLKNFESWAQLVNREVLKKGTLNSSLVLKMHQSRNFHFFGLWKDDILQSTTLMYIQNEVAGIYFVATDRDARGYGYATRLVKHAINYCISEGIVNFVLHSTRYGINMYSRLGFSQDLSYGIYWKLGNQ